jgi:uncharacterized membrane protein YdjX (TVP38/TMEM64 family)
VIDLFDFLSQYENEILVFVILAILIFEVFLFSFPKEIVMVYAGLAFGTTQGTLINIIGLFGAAWLGFEGGIGSRFAVERWQKHPMVLKYSNWLHENGFKALLVLRLFPLTPNDILSIASGFSHIKRVPYLLITFFTAIPYAFLWAYLGATNLDLIEKYFPQVYDPNTWITGFILVLVMFFFLVKFGAEETEEDNA